MLKRQIALKFLRQRERERGRNDPNPLSRHPSRIAVALGSAPPPLTQRRLLHDALPPRHALLPVYYSLPLV